MVTPLDRPKSNSAWSLHRPALRPMCNIAHIATIQTELAGTRRLNCDAMSEKGQKRKWRQVRVTSSLTPSNLGEDDIERLEDVYKRD